MSFLFLSGFSGFSSLESAFDSTPPSRGIGKTDRILRDTLWSKNGNLADSICNFQTYIIRESVLAYRETVIRLHTMMTRCWTNRRIESAPVFDFSSANMPARRRARPFPSRRSIGRRNPGKKKRLHARANRRVSRGRKEDEYTLRRGCQSSSGGQYIERDTLRKMTAQIAPPNAGMAGFSGRSDEKVGDGWRRLFSRSRLRERNNYRVALTGVLSARSYRLFDRVRSIPRCSPRVSIELPLISCATVPIGAIEGSVSRNVDRASSRASAYIHCGNFFFSFHRDLLCLLRHDASIWRYPTKARHQSCRSSHVPTAQRTRRHDLDETPTHRGRNCFGEADRVSVLSCWKFSSKSAREDASSKPRNWRRMSFSSRNRYICIYYVTSNVTRETEIHETGSNLRGTMT